MEMLCALACIEAVACGAAAAARRRGGSGDSHRENKRTCTVTDSHSVL